MGTYQYYEFAALDRPLTRREIDALRALSSRAEISERGLKNVYHYGSFRGDPRELMTKYFDAMVYVASWGTRTLMLRLPRAAFTPKELAPYRAEPGLRIEVSRGHTLLEFTRDDEAGAGWIEDTWSARWMPALAPLRSELLRGERTALYLGWLASVAPSRRGGRAAPEDLDDDFDNDPDDDAREAEEPPVPAGLGKLSHACRALVEYLEIDEDLVAAAAEQSGPGETEASFRARLAARLKRASTREKDGWLMRVALGEGEAVRGEVLGGLGPGREGASRARPPARRTLDALLERANALREARESRRARAEASAKAARARREARALETRLAGLEGREAEAWKEVEALVASKETKSYDAAASKVRDLGALAARRGLMAAFERELRDLRKRHASKAALLRRLGAAGLERKRGG